MCVLKNFNFSYKGAPGGVLSKKEQSYYSFLEIVRENSKGYGGNQESYVTHPNFSSFLN